MTIGEDFELTLTVRHPAGGALVAPAAADLEPFEVLESAQEEATPYESRLRYRLAAYELPGSVELPALEVGYRDASGELGSLRTETIAIELLSSLTEDLTEIHDIKEPVALEVPRSARPFVWAAAGALFAAIAYLAYRRWRRAGIRSRGGAGARAAGSSGRRGRARAPEARRAAPQSSRPSSNRFYTELTEIMKRYAGRRYRVAYLERTTGEMLGDLKRRQVSHPAPRAHSGGVGPCQVRARPGRPTKRPARRSRWRTSSSATPDPRRFRATRAAGPR